MAVNSGGNLGYIEPRLGPTNIFTNSFNTAAPDARNRAALFRWIFRNNVTGERYEVMTLRQDSEPRLHLSDDRNEWRRWTLESVYREVPGNASERVYTDLGDPMDSELSLSEIDEYNRLQSHSVVAIYGLPVSNSPRDIREWIERTRGVVAGAGTTFSRPSPSMSYIVPSADSVHPNLNGYAEALERARTEADRQMAISPSVISGSSTGRASDSLAEAFRFASSAVDWNTMGNIRGIQEAPPVKKPKAVRLMGLIDTDCGTSKILGMGEVISGSMLHWSAEVLCINEFRESIPFWPQSNPMIVGNTLRYAYLLSEMEVSIRAGRNPQAVPNYPFMCFKRVGAMPTLSFFKDGLDFLERQDSGLPPPVIFYTMNIGGDKYVPIDPTETILSSF